MSIFSDKVIVTVLMKYLSPISFSMLKESIPDFYRCWVVKNTPFINFFKQRLLTNLIIYFGQTKQAFKIATMLMNYLHCDKTRRILTGSFLLCTLNGDNVNECGDIDIITNLYDSYVESNTITRFPLSVFFENYFDMEHFGSEISAELTDPPCLGYNKDTSLKDILNIYIYGKKIQFLNINEEDQIEYINKFDLPICKNAYYSNILKVQNFERILKRNLILNLSTTYFPRVIISNIPFVYDSLCPSIYKRLLKYQNRSYDMCVYLDSNVDNINIKFGKLDIHDSNKIHDEVQKIFNHDCYYSKCLENMSPKCPIPKLSEYVLKREIIAVWRYFWNKHTNDDLKLTDCDCCNTSSKKIKRSKTFHGYDIELDGDDESA